MARNNRHTNTWLCANGVHLDVTAARSEQPELAHIWWPLQIVARAAMDARLLWPIHLDDFRQVGQHLRSSQRPSIWVYVHVRTGAELFVDDDGQTYRLTPLRSEPVRGRFTTCNLHTAALRCRLHETIARPPTDPALRGPERLAHRPRRLVPGPRREARQRARAAQGWPESLPPAGSALAPPLDDGRARRSNPPAFATILSGPPQTPEFTERWEPRLRSLDPALQDALDQLELMPPPPPKASGDDTKPGPGRSQSRTPKRRSTPSPKPATSSPPNGHGRGEVPRHHQLRPPATRPRHW